MATIPPRPNFFSPLTPEERAILADWDRMYGSATTTPTPGAGTGGATSGYYQSLYDYLLNSYGQDAAAAYAANPSGAFDASGNFQIKIGNRSIQIGSGTLPYIIGSNPVVTNPPTTTPPPSGGGDRGNPPVVIDPSFPGIPGGGSAGTPATGANPYAAIASLLPGYGLAQQLGASQHGFGIPGFENTPTKAGGSWAGTTFMPNLATTLRQDPIPGTDFYEEYRLRHGLDNPSSPNTDWLGIPYNVAGPGRQVPGTGTVNTGTGSQGGYWANQGGEGQTPYWVEVPGSAGAGANIETGAGTKVGGWGINRAVPYQTTWYLSTYGGKPPPFINIHEQIGKAMEGVPTAYPTFNWAGPNAMAAAQPSATGFPPGGWTQMLGFTPGAPTNYGFIGGRPNPYGYTNTPLLPSLAAG